MKRIIVLLSLVTTTTVLFAQDCEIKGTIVDHENHRIPGANILIKGTPDGVVANAEGEFSLRLPPGETSLLFAFVKYKTIEKTFTLQKDGNYVLEVKMVPKWYLKRGSISITHSSFTTGSR